jgi:hypothetical protein
VKRLAWRVTFHAEEGDSAYVYELEAPEVMKPTLVKHQAWLLHNRQGRAEVDMFNPEVVCLGEVETEN